MPHRTDHSFRGDTIQPSRCFSQLTCRVHVGFGSLMPFKTTLFVTVLSIVAMAPFMAAAQVIGGFDASRGGIFSLASGSENAALRASILAEYPAAQFTETTLLDASYLSGVDVLIVGSASEQASGITPLSAAEQSALSQYVQGGGAAVILTDNDALPDLVLANESLASVFGLTTTGTLSGTQPASVVVPDHPITNGPHGSTTVYSTVFPGWYSALGTSTVLARLDNAPGMAATCVWFGPGDFLQSSGSALFLSDHVFPRVLVLNMIAFQQQQPPTVPVMSAYGLMSLVIGLAAICAYAMRIPTGDATDRLRRSPE